MTLVETLIQRQQSLAMRDAEFAAHIGVSRPMWAMVRTGTKRPGHLFLQGVMRRFPELASACLIYIRDTPAFLLPENVTDSNVEDVTEQVPA